MTEVISCYEFIFAIKLLLLIVVWEVARMVLRNMNTLQFRLKQRKVIYFKEKKKHLAHKFCFIYVLLLFQFVIAIGQNSVSVLWIVIDVIYYLNFIRRKQELQNEVGALLEFRDLVIETFPDLKNKMASISASSTGVPSASSLASRWVNESPMLIARFKCTRTTVIDQKPNVTKQVFCIFFFIRFNFSCRS